jgi:hypothetical protein
MVLMVKNSMAQLIGVTLFQFIISIVDPSILTQPLPSGEPSSFQAGTVTTVPAAPSATGNATPKNSSLPVGLGGVLQHGATQQPP